MDHRSTLGLDIAVEDIDALLLSGFDPSTEIYDQSPSCRASRRHGADPRPIRSGR